MLADQTLQFCVKALKFQYIEKLYNMCADFYLTAVFCLFRNPGYLIVLEENGQGSGWVGVPLGQ